MKGDNFERGYISVDRNRRLNNNENSIEQEKTTVRDVK